MFKELAALLKPGADLVVTITCPTAGVVSLAILRKNFADALPPLVVTAPAEELDGRFAELVMTPLEATATAISNSEQYEKLAKKLEEDKRAKLTAPKKGNAAARQLPAPKPASPVRADPGDDSSSDEEEDEESADGSSTPPAPSAETPGAQLGLFATN